MIEARLTLSEPPAFVRLNSSSVFEGSMCGPVQVVFGLFPFGDDLPELNSHCITFARRMSPNQLSVTEVVHQHDVFFPLVNLREDDGLSHRSLQVVTPNSFPQCKRKFPSRGELVRRRAASFLVYENRCQRTTMPRSHQQLRRGRISLHYQTSLLRSAGIFQFHHAKVLANTRTIKRIRQV